MQKSSSNSNTSETHPMTANSVGALSVLHRTVSYALNPHSRVRGNWLVVICPDGSEYLTMYRAYGGAILPDTTIGIGRTSVLPNGLKLSICGSAEPNFIPDDSEFSVLFLGWGDDTTANNKNMTTWRKQAQSVLSL